VAEPFRDTSQVHQAYLVAHDRRLFTESAAGVHIWDVAVDLEAPLPAWVPELAEALAGRRFDVRGQFVPTVKSLGQMREELLALKGDDFWSRLGRWFFLREPNRTISPDSSVTVAEMEQVIQSGAGAAR
jgi:hypothetical protein